jgi:inosose dehydratase
MGLAAAARGPLRFHIGNYGMQTMTVDAALAAIRKIGYDGAELCLMPDWPSAPEKLSTAERRRIRESGFPIPTVIENFNALASDEQHRVSLDRIRSAAALAHEIAPQDPPILQTVLGGKPGEWPAVRDRMTSRLADWAKVAGECRIRFAVKAHAMQAVDTPGKLIELLDQVKHPALTAIYDYGHFQLRDLSIEQSMDELLPRSAFITVKDSKVVDGKPRFLLPGDGTVDYPRYFKKVKQMGWRGWVLVEITRQLQTAPGYDPVRAAEHSYTNLAPAMRAAGVR